MAERPYTLLSCSISMDGYLDAASPPRLLLSNAADFDRVDGVRSGCGAILVGAETVRQDDPRLIVRSTTRRRQRRCQGQAESPTKVTVTASGRLEPTARFFTTGDGEKLVYCASPVTCAVRDRLGSAATVIDAGQPVRMRWIAENLLARGIRRLMVEGGGQVLTQFLTADLADELHLVIAPLFVGDTRAPRFAGEGRYPWHPGRRAGLVDVQQIGDVVLLRYRLSDRCAG